jgi:hypothetical protein
VHGEVVEINFNFQLKRKIASCIIEMIKQFGSGVGMERADGMGNCFRIENFTLCLTGSTAMRCDVRNLNLFSLFAGIS